MMGSTTGLAAAGDALTGEVAADTDGVAAEPVFVLGFSGGVTAAGLSGGGPDA